MERDAFYFFRTLRYFYDESAHLGISGKQWFRDRKLLSPSLHFNAIEKFSIIMSEKMENMIENLEKEVAKNSGKPINIVSIMYNIALDIVCGKKRPKSDARWHASAKQLVFAQSSNSTQRQYCRAIVCRRRYYYTNRLDVT